MPRWFKSLRRSAPSSGISSDHGRLSGVGGDQRILPLAHDLARYRPVSRSGLDHSATRVPVAARQLQIGGVRKNGCRRGCTPARAAPGLAGHTKEIDAMQEFNGSGGLCLTCNNAPSCFHRARRGPALCCELFDDYVPAGLRARDDRLASSADSSITSTAQVQEEAEYAGLCTNCENRRTCALPKPAGGVWHCEEYR